MSVSVFSTAVPVPLMSWQLASRMHLWLGLWLQGL